MNSRARSIALLAANPALASILSRTLTEEAKHRVAAFAALPALSTYLRITPVDVAVLSLDLPWNELVAIVRGLKVAPHSANPLIEVIVLTHAVPLAASLTDTGISAVLAKPVSPQKLLDAVSEALAAERAPGPRRVRPAVPARRPTPARQPTTRGPAAKIIQLFGSRPSA